MIEAAPILDNAYVRLQMAAALAATSLHNTRRGPTARQAIAGNYLKPPFRWNGLVLRLENVLHSVREGESPGGKAWSNRMAAHYGEIEGTIGADGDPIDVFVGLFPELPHVWVINQSNADGGFDEHKCMLGFATEEQARDAYLLSFDRGWTGLQSIVPATLAQFKWWLKFGDKSRAFSLDQLPFDGQPAMSKTLWNANAEPTTLPMNKLVYELRLEDSAAGLLLDAVSMADIMGDPDITSVPVLDALVVEVARMSQKMTMLQKVMNGVGALQVPAFQISDPVKSRGVMQVAVLFELSDGQTVTVWFHNPDTTPAKLMPLDELISWKWMLNKKDITIVVAPERGRDLQVREVARRIMKLAERNGPAFAKANEKLARKIEQGFQLDTEIVGLEKKLADVTHKVEVARQNKIDAGAKATGDEWSEINPNLTKAEQDALEARQAALAEQLAAMPEEQLRLVAASAPLTIIGAERGDRDDITGKILANHPDDIEAAIAKNASYQAPEPVAEVAPPVPAIPAAVLDAIRFQVQRLQDFARQMDGVVAARGHGWNLALELRDLMPAIESANGRLAEIRGFAEPKGLTDAFDAYVAELGGVPDFSAYGEPAADPEPAAMPEPVAEPAPIQELIDAGFTRVQSNDYARSGEVGANKLGFNIRVTEEGFHVGLTVGFEGGITGGKIELGDTADVNAAIAMVDAEIARRTAELAPAEPAAVSNRSGTAEEQAAAEAALAMAAGAVADLGGMFAADGHSGDGVAGAWSYGNAEVNGASVRLAASGGGVVQVNGKPHGGDGELILTADQVKAAILAVAPVPAPVEEPAVVSSGEIVEPTAEEFAALTTNAADESAATVKGWSEEDYRAKFEGLEADNLHDEALVLMAKRLGGPIQVGLAEAISTEQAAAGHLTPELSDRAAKLRDTLRAMAAPAVKGDISYKAVDDMFTSFYPDSEAGEGAWNVINATEGSEGGKVLTQHAASVIEQLRAAGYTVTEAAPVTETADELLAALAEPAPADPVPAAPEQVAAAPADEPAAQAGTEITEPEKPETVTPLNAEISAETASDPAQLVSVPSEEVHAAKDADEEADHAFLNGLIDGSGDLLSEDTFPRMEPMFAKYPEGSEMFALLERAATLFGEAVQDVAKQAMAL